MKKCENEGFSVKKQRTLMPARQPRQTQLSTMASHGCSRPASAAKGCARDSSALSLWCALSTAHGTLCSRGRVAAAPWAQAARASPHAAAAQLAQPPAPNGGENRETVAQLRAPQRPATVEAAKCARSGPLWLPSVLYRPPAWRAGRKTARAPASRRHRQLPRPSDLSQAKARKGIVRRR